MSSNTGNNQTMNPLESSSLDSEQSNNGDQAPLLYDGRPAAAKQQLDWQLIGIRILAFFAGSMLGMTLLALTLASVYTSPEEMSHPLLVIGALLLLLLAIIIAHKWGGREELANSGLFATSGVFAAYTGLLGAASMAISSTVTAIATLIFAKWGQSSERSILHGGHNKVRVLLMKTASASTSSQDQYKGKVIALINSLPLTELNYHNKRQITLLEDAIMRGNTAAVIALINRGVDTESAFMSQGRLRGQTLGTFLATKNIDIEIVRHIQKSYK